MTLRHKLYFLENHMYVHKKKWILQTVKFLIRLYFKQ